MFGWRKTFSGKYIFSENANFRKRKMFPWCLVAFQKIFRKIFSGVWKRRRKTQIQKNTSHSPGKNHQRRHWTASDDRAVDRDRRRDRDLAKARSWSSQVRAVDRDLDPVRSCEGEIAIDGEIAIFARSRSTASRDRGLEIAINDGAGSRTGDRGRGLEIADWRSRSTTARSQTGDRDLARAHSLSLSLIFRKHFEGKIEV